MRLSLFSTPLLYLFLLTVVSFNHSYTQQAGSLRGFVTDSTNGEALVFCNVFIKDLKVGASTNDRGLFLIKSIPSNVEYELLISYVGYKTKSVKVVVQPSIVTQLDVQLMPLSVELQTIEKVSDKIIKENATDISLERISVKELEILPKGIETDIFRSLQYIPGVSTTGDITARYYVRGGGGDQNQILINGVEVYNPFHSLGLFSVIDPEMINSLEFYKGGYTAEYSGRISSVMNVISKDGNKNSVGFKGAASFLTAKGLLEGPIPNGSFMITGRKSYNNDVLKKFFNEQTVPVDFYDYSFKLNYSSAEIFENAKFSIFGFSSDDNVDYEDPAREQFTWSNSLLGFEWLQIYDAPVFSRLGISSSQFDGEVIPNLSSLKPRQNELSDFTVSFDVNAVFQNKDEMGAGLKLKTIDTKFSQVNLLGAETNLEKFAGNLSLYGKYKFLRFENFGIDVGTRFNVTGLSKNGGGSFEPRISLSYRVFPSVTFKAAWGIYKQELISISDEDEIISVFEPWLIVPDYLETPTAIHYIGGLNINIFTGVNFGVEGYYKIMNNLAIVNDQKYLSSDPDFISGSGESYGWEFSLAYGIDPLNISTSYTLSWAYKEEDQWIYYPRYDSRHAGNIILEYNFGGGWVASTIWNFSSGYPFTELIGYYDKFYPEDIGSPDYNPGEFIPYAILGDRNLGRLPEYHRLDFSLIKRLQISLLTMELGVSVINAYDRANIFYFDRNTGEVVNMLPLLISGTIKIEI